MFDFEKLTKITQNILIEAQNLVKINKNTFLEPAHIFLAVLNSSNNEAVEKFLNVLKLNNNLVKSDVQNLINTYPKITDNTVQLYFSNFSRYFYKGDSFDYFVLNDVLEYQICFSY